MIDLRTGNCINLALELEDESIDCTVTSPPYNKCGVGGGLFGKIEYAAFDDTLPEDEYQEQQIELLDILFDKTKEGGSLFYNHKVRYFNGDSISPWAWLTKTKWNIREEIIWSVVVVLKSLDIGSFRLMRESTGCVKVQSIPDCLVTLCRVV